MANKTTNTTRENVVTNKREHKLNIKPIGEQEYEVIRYDNPEIVEQAEKAYPEMTMEFKRILFDQYELFCAKNHDYGPANIALGSSLTTEEDKKLSLSGVWFRMMDKVNRLKQLVVVGTNGKVDESVIDTYQDLSNYAIISQIIKNGKWGK